MNKKITITSLILVLLLSLSSISAFAQGGNPPENRGMGGEQQTVLAEALGITVEELMTLIQNGSTLAELYYDAGIEVPYFALENSKLADVLGITPEELQARLDAGETLSELHAEAGLDLYSFEMNMNMNMNSQNRQNDNKNENNPEQVKGDMLQNKYTQQLRMLAQVMGETEEGMQMKLNEYFGEIMMQAGIPVMGRGTNGGMMGGNGQNASDGQGGRGPGAPAQ